MQTVKLRFQKWDILAIVGVVILAALVLVLFLSPNHSGGAYARIYQDGQLVKTVSLTEDQEFTVTGAYTNTISVRDGKIAVICSDCPGEDCVGCGWIDGGGRSIVCLPNGLEIRIVSGDDDVDFVVG